MICYDAIKNNRETIEDVILRDVDKLWNLVFRKENPL